MQMNDDKNLLDLPNELLIEIFLYCSIRDLCRLPQTSKRLRNVVKSNYLWYQKWLELVNVSGLSFADYIKQPTENDNYHSRCKRLWNICQGFREDCELPVCEYCKFKTCTKECLEKYERKISIDIGSKVTWFVTSTFLIQRHPSVIIGSISKNHSKDCIYRNVCNKTELSSFHKERQFCLICNRYKDFRIGVDQDDVIPFNNDDKPSTSKVVNDKEINPTSYNISTEFSLWADLHHYFQNKFPNCKLFSPLDSLIGNADFNILEHYLYHIFDYFKSLEEIRKPNVSFIFCLPFNADFDVQKNLIKFMFETMQASRICFVNKALCIALLIGTETCLVVDSGASNTVVSVIVNNAVLFERTQHCQVGGTSISNYLAQVIKLKGFLNTVNAASLDDKRVKASCFLSYNIAAEEKRKVTKKQNIFVRSTRNSQLQKLEMGSELYLAPEIMYAEMNLPNMIKQAISGLDENVAKEALSHLLLTGNNTELNGFATRLLRDLQTVLPRFAHVVDVRAYAGSRSWDAAVGATRVPLPDSNTAEPGGSYFFITREEYVLRGHAK